MNTGCCGDRLLRRRSGLLLTPPPAGPTRDRQAPPTEPPHLRMKTEDTMDSAKNLPVAVIGAGPVGLAAAAHLIERGLEPLILEAGPSAGAAIEQWRHIRLFSPWRYNIDAAAVRLLEAAGWESPRPDRAALRRGTHRRLPRAAGRAARRSAPGCRPAPGSSPSPGTAWTRPTPGTARPHRSSSGSSTPDGETRDHTVAAVIDASGTWSTRNPLGTSGLPAIGEDAAADRISSPLPDVTGRDRGAFAGRRVLVVGAGHSAANTLISLADLAKDEPGTRVLWAVRGASADEGLRRRRRRRAARPRPARCPPAPPRRGRDHRTAHRLRHRFPQSPGFRRDRRVR